MAVKMIAVLDFRGLEEGREFKAGGEFTVASAERADRLDSLGFAHRKPAEPEAPEPEAPAPVAPKKREG